MAMCCVLYSNGMCDVRCTYLCVCKHKWLQPVCLRFKLFHISYYILSVALAVALALALAIVVALIIAFVLHLLVCARLCFFVWLLLGIAALFCSCVLCVVYTLNRSVVCMAMRIQVECRCAIATAVTVTVAVAANAHTSLDDSRNVSASSYTDRKQHETDTIFCDFRLYIGWESIFAP